MHHKERPWWQREDTPYRGSDSAYCGSDNVYRGNNGGNRNYRGGTNNQGGRRHVCQLCGKVGHVVAKCYHRFDHSYQVDENHVAAFASNPSYGIDSNCYSDTGATDHISNDVDHLTMRERYNGKEQLQATNDSALSILNVGHSNLVTPSKYLCLRNVLHAPNVTQNLLSVYHFLADNNVFFEFHPGSFFVKDRLTRRTTIQGKCEGGLYPIAAAKPVMSKEVLLSTKPSTELWHRRLGHPSISVVQQVLQSKNLDWSPNKSVATICDACQMAKSHQLPFSNSSSRSSSPLELVFSDVWAPTTKSIGAFKYYVS